MFIKESSAIFVKFCIVNLMMHIYGNGIFRKCDESTCPPDLVTILKAENIAMPKVTAKEDKKGGDSDDKKDPGGKGNGRALRPLDGAVAVFGIFIFFIAF